MRTEAEVRRALELNDAEPGIDEYQVFAKRVIADTLRYCLGEQSAFGLSLHNRERRAERAQRQ